MLPLLSLIALQGQAAQTPAGPFTNTFEVVETRRLALTPLVDGVMSEEEWDPLSKTGGFDSYFQWEPRKLHFAAELPKGQDLLVSVDLNKDGWLIGADNLEARVSMKNGKAVLKARVLDNSDPNAPEWKEMPSLEAASEVAGTEGEKTWIAELTLEDSNEKLIPGEKASPIAVRCDMVPAKSAASTEFIPRLGTTIELLMDRAAALPEGLKWKPDVSGRVIVPGDKTRMRMTFNGRDSLGLNRIQLRAEGRARQYMSLFEIPFPDFDKKGRTFVDYNTKVKEKAPFGYRLLRGTLTSEDGGTAVMQTSFRIAPLIDFDLAHEILKSKDEDQTERLSVFLRSNSNNRLDGYFRVLPPSGFQVRSGTGKNFIIYNARGSVRRVFELDIPAKAKGIYPITLQADIGGRSVQQVAFVQIG